MKNNEIIEKLLEHLFTNENLIDRSNIRKALDISNKQDSNSKKFSDLFFMNLINLKVISNTEPIILNSKYEEVYKYSEIRVKSIINVISPLLQKLIAARTKFQDIIRVPLKSFSVEDEDNEASNEYANHIIKEFNSHKRLTKYLEKVTDKKKHSILQEKIDEKFYNDYEIIEMEGIGDVVNSIKIFEYTVIDLFDRLICNTQANVDGSYNFKDEKKSIFELIFLDVAFKEILFLILQNNMKTISSKYITDKLVEINYLLAYPIKGERTLHKYKNNIIDTFFNLKILVGERPKKKKIVSYQVGPTQLERFDKEWKMNALTKLDSIKYIIGTISQSDNIDQKKIDAVLKVFCFTN